MFENVKTVEFELRNLFLLLAAVCLALAIAGTLEIGTIGYQVATILSVIVILKLSSDASNWVRKNIGTESAGQTRQAKGID